MRIALCSDTYTPQVNGVTTVLRRMVDALTGTGHQVGIVAPQYPSGERDGPNPVLRIPSVPFPPYPAIRLSLPLLRRVNRFLAGFDPDVVHVTTEGPLGLVCRYWALRCRVPLVTSFHTDFPRYCRDYGVGALESTVWRWLSWFHRPARITHTPGEAIRERLVDRGIAHATVWGRGVDTKLFRPQRRNPAWRRQHGIPDDAVLVLHVGRLAAEKNLAVMLQAWAVAREALGSRIAFVIAGDGPEVQRVAAQAPWTHRLGFLDPDVLADLYANADMCALPSTTETCGLVALEALASGLPVLAADAGGFRESVRDGHNGLLLDPRDPLAFGSAIVALATQPDRRRVLGANARDTAERRDIREENAALIRQYQTICGTPIGEAARSAA